jgi:hypothetical protein
MNALVEPIIETIKQALGYRVGPLEARLATLEARVTDLEQKPSMKFRRVFEQGQSYQPGDVCVHGGSLRACRAETVGQPSRDYVAWQLVVKSRSVVGCRLLRHHTIAFFASETCSTACPGP